MSSYIKEGLGRKKKFTLDHSWDDLDNGRRSTTLSTISTISGRSLPPPYSEDPASLLETEEEKKLRRRSHWVAYTTMFVMTVGFSVVLSGVWPYLEQLEGKDTRSKTALGWVVAANPFGQMIASPIVGFIGNKIGGIRKVCYFTVTCYIIGNLLYSFLPAVNNPYPWMIFSRFIVGISSSNVTLCRSYLASSTTIKERTKGIAIISAAQSLGFVVGPAIQTILSLSVPEDYKYRSAGWVAACLGFINLVILNPRIFQEYNISLREREMITTAGNRDGLDEVKLPKADKVAIISVLVAFFMNQFVYVLLETLMEPFTTDQYSWCHDIAVVVVGVSFVFAGLLAVGMFVNATRLAKKYDERKILIFGALIPICIGLLLFQPFPGSEDLDYCPKEDETTGTSLSTSSFTTISSLAIESSFNLEGINTTGSQNYKGPAHIFRMPFYKSSSQQFLSEDLKMVELHPSFAEQNKNRTINILEMQSANDHAISSIQYTMTKNSNSRKNDKDWCDPDECLGCSYDQDWCIDYPRLPIAQFYVAFAIVVSAYPYGVAMSNAILSKIIGPKPQGTWMGILTASGSLSRVTGPIFVSYVYTEAGTRWCFGTLFVCMVVSLIQLTIFYPRLVPMKLPNNENKHRV